ncbi:MAG: hypothetical protein A3A86_00050 [Elusimicrobia bacterium RIFCSPLOWO2_01_FULL_60_11]|nr:MAG: hypothetical protein A3A86_00050 [Elusimicrobia bacterium RIFCSPLOWO2_01_FULL_60_11]
MNRPCIIAIFMFSLFGCAGKASFPVINDVTTDPYNPPRFVMLAGPKANKGRDMAYPLQNLEIQQKHYPDILPVKSKFSADQAFAKCKLVGLDMARWDLVNEDLKNYLLEFTATTAWMRYKDDVVIQVTPERTGSSIHMRSKSRLGKSDLGANAKRIRGFFLKFRESEKN